jgi:hypothetical protein
LSQRDTSRGDTSHPAEFIPTQAQWRYLREFLVHDGPNNLRAIAQRANVNVRTVYDWRRDERFVQWFNDECAREFSHGLRLVQRTLWRLAIAGSPEHIKLAMQWAGISNAGTHDPARSTTYSGVFINVPRPDPAQLAALDAQLALPAERVVATELSMTEHNIEDVER